MKNPLGKILILNFLLFVVLFFSACGPEGFQAVVDEEDVTPDVPKSLKPVTKDDLRETFEVDAP